MAYTSVNPYCSLVELCEEIKIEVPTAGTDLEDELKRAIDRASRWVDEYTRRDYYFHDHRTDALRFDQFTGRFYEEALYLPHSPVISITEVLLGDDTLVADEDYVQGLRENEGILFRLCGSWNPTAPDYILTIKGAFGYLQGTLETPDSSAVPTGLPGKIAMATRLVAAAVSGHNRKEIVGVEGIREEILQTEIPKTVYQLLGRRMPVLV